MLNTDQSPTQLDQEQPGLPPELYMDLSNYDPRSHEFQEGIAAANQLAAEAGCRALTIADIFPPQELDPPEGFTSDQFIKKGFDVPVEDINQRIHGFTPGSDERLSVDLHRMVTDSGHTINLVDLRPHMSANVRKGGPQSPAEIKALDRSVQRDLKILAEEGKPRRIVTGVKGVGYTRVGNSKIRGYWMILGGETGGVVTAARFADCGNNPKSEAGVYRRVFGKDVKF